VALILQSPANTLYEDTDGLSLEACLPHGESPARLPARARPEGLGEAAELGMAWFGAAGLTYLVLTIVEVSLALRLNGGSGGTLSIAGIALASARPGHARLFQPPC
jgi:hypothetical protein